MSRRDPIDVEWTDSDRDYVEQESEELSLSDGLYRIACPDCGTRLTWVLDPDPDSLSYSAECNPCENKFRMNVTKVRCTKSDSNR